MNFKFFNKIFAEAALDDQKLRTGNPGPGRERESGGADPQRGHRRTAAKGK